MLSAWYMACSPILSRCILLMSSRLSLVIGSATLYIHACLEVFVFNYLFSLSSYRLYSAGLGAIWVRLRHDWICRRVIRALSDFVRSSEAPESWETRQHAGQSIY